MTDLSQSSSGRLSAFPRWWARELAALVPAPLRRLFGGQARWLVLDIDDDGVVLGQGREYRRLREVDRLSRAGGDAPFAAGLERLLGRRLAGRRLALRVPAEWALQKRLTLPLATAENLRQVLAFEMDRQTPFRTEDVFFTYTIAARDKASEQITVDLTVLPRQRVGDILDHIAAMGARASVLEISSSENGSIGAGNLLPSEDREDHRPSFGILNWLLLVVAASLLAALIYLTIDRQRQVLSQLNARADTARQAAQTVPILRKKAAAIAAEAGFLHRRKASSTSTVLLLDELSGLLPDNTWLSLLEVKGREVKLTGFSKSSSELLALIEGSPRFADARFLSPVTRDARRNAEKFSLTASLVTAPDGKE